MFDYEKPIALIDMDETSFDFRLQANRYLLEMGAITEPIEDTVHPRLYDDMTDILGSEIEAVEVVDELFNRDDFWETMPMIAGAQAGVLAVLEAGIQVRFCSKPPKLAPLASRAKRISIESNFEGALGVRLASEAFIDKDKTFALGTVLLDDEKQIDGLRIPSFLHVVYTRRSNVDQPNLFRINDWSEDQVLKFIDLTQATHNF